jgi:hypothetical protein
MGKDNLNELYSRRKLCLLCIQLVSEVPLDDPRREGAIAEYNRQLAAIDKRIEAIEGKPPDIVIGLKPAILFPKVEKVK